MVCLDLPFWGAVLLLCGITVVYDALGGMRAVIWSDVVQVVVLFGSIVAAVAMAIHLVGGLENVFSRFDPQRLQAVDFAHHGLGDGQTFAFWPMLMGGCSSTCPITAAIRPKPSGNFPRAVSTTPGRPFF
jgi:SSS family solute:Na+ symporter